MNKQREAADPSVTKAAGQSISIDSEIPVISGLEEDILTVLLGQELYGLQICKAIQEASHGHQTLKIGSLYPSLHRLEKKGLINSRMDGGDVRSRGGNRRKYYRIMGKGAEALSQKRRTRENLMKWRPSPA